MLKYLIGGVVAVVVIIGVVISSSDKDNSLVPNETPSAEDSQSAAAGKSGLRELTKEAAAEAILAALQANERKSWLGEQMCAAGLGFAADGMNATELEQRGYVKIISLEGHTVVTFNEQARPYIYDLGEMCPRFILFVPERTTVTEFIEAGIEAPEKTTYVKFISDYKATPVGEIITKETNKRVGGQAAFVLREGNWQLEYAR